MSKGYLKSWKNEILRNKKKLIFSLIFLIISLILTGLAGDFVDETASNSVPDLLLNNIPTVNLSLIFVYGIVLVIAIYLLYPLLYNPRRLHYAISMLSLFVLIRTGFTILTHLKIPIDAAIVSAPSLLRSLTFSNDLFFSGHAGLPFLGFLIYDNKKVKYFMLTSSIILAIVVLLMHVHYTIDVASAYFITYGIYKIGEKLFEDKDKIKK